MVSEGMIREPLKPEAFDTIPLCGIVVRPVTPDERQMWDRLMSQYHYLGLKSLVGKSIRYVAEIQGRWLALHTQHNLARFLVQEKQADYCFTVEDNQSDLKEAIAYLICFLIPIPFFTDP